MVGQRGANDVNVSKAAHCATSRVGGRARAIGPSDCFSAVGELRKRRPNCQSRQPSAKGIAFLMDYGVA